jgi:hypothetical protein
VSSHHGNRTVRRAARLCALVPAVVVTGLAGSAVASPPEEWPSGPSTSTLHTLLLLGGIPLALFVLITLLVYLPSMSHGQSYRPGEVWRGGPTWFGGPRGGIDAVDQAPPAVASGEQGGTRGGTSGQW